MASAYLSRPIRLLRDVCRARYPDQSPTDCAACVLSDLCHRQTRTQNTCQRLQGNQPDLPIYPVRNDAGEQGEQEHGAEIRKLQSLHQKALVGTANGLACDRPTLGGVLGPIASVRDAGADPKNEKRPVPKNSQRPSDG